MGLEFFNNTEFLLLQTIAVSLCNLVIPFLFGMHRRLKTALMTLVAFIYSFNILCLDFFYYYGGRINVNLIEFRNFSIGFYLEGLGLVFLTMLGILWMIAILYTTSYLQANKEEQRARFMFFISLCIIFASLVALSSNLVTMFIFYELLTLATAPLIAHSGSTHARKSLRRYLIILMSTSLLLLLPAILAVDYFAGTTEFVAGGLLQGHLDKTQATILFLMFIFGAAKAAIMPVHQWLPTAMVASYPVSALLHAVAVVKAGLFVIYKVIIYIFGIKYLHSLFGSDSWFVYSPMITMFFASIMALRQETVKKMLAYSTISQLSFALMSAFMFTPQAMVAAILHMLSHSLSKITIFFASGNIYTMTRKNKTLEMTGVAYIMPKSIFFFAIGALSLIGAPPLAGFVSKYYVIHAAAMEENYIIMIAIIFSTLMTASYIFRIIYLAYCRPTRKEKQLTNLELPAGMKIATFLSMLGIIFFVLYVKSALVFLEYIS